MDRVFSRRSFLKCTALTAVAVAGSGLLSGCTVGEHPVQTAVGTTNTVLKVQSTLERVSFEGSHDSDGTLTYRFKVYNGRINDIGLDHSHFFVKSRDFYSYMDGRISVKLVQEKDSVVDAQIKYGQTAIVEVTVTDIPALEANDTVSLTYYPDTQYVKLASATWTLDRAALGLDSESLPETGTPMD